MPSLGSGVSLPHGVPRGGGVDHLGATDTEVGWKLRGGRFLLNKIALGVHKNRMGHLNTTVIPTPTLSMPVKARHPSSVGFSQACAFITQRQHKGSLRLYGAGQVWDWHRVNIPSSWIPPSERPPHSAAVPDRLSCTACPLFIIYSLSATSHYNTSSTRAETLFTIVPLMLRTMPDKSQTCSDSHCE